jgi:hypothetical protein
MKIDPNLTIGSVGPKSPVRPQGRKGAFEEVLSGIEQKVIRASTLLHAIPPSQITPQRIKALGMSEQAIDALEGYARMLADPNTSLKTLQTNVDELSAVRAELHEASGACGLRGETSWGDMACSGWALRPLYRELPERMHP